MGFNPCEKELYGTLGKLRDLAGFPQPKVWEKYPGRYVRVIETDLRVYAPTFAELERFFLKKCREAGWLADQECGLSIQKHHKSYHAIAVAFHRLQTGIIGCGKNPETACIDLILQYAYRQRLMRGGTIAPLDQTRRNVRTCTAIRSNVRRMR